MNILSFEDLPNELILIIFSYLTKFDLFKSFLQLNIRLNKLLLKYVHHINLSSTLTSKQVNEYTKNYVPFVQNYVNSITIDNYFIGNYFLQGIKELKLENIHHIKLVDNAIFLHDEILKRFKPDTLTLVVTSLNQENKLCQFSSTSLKQLEIEFETAEYAKNCLSNQFKVLSPSTLVCIRISFSKLSEYFQLFKYDFPFHIHKLYVSIFTIDKTDYDESSIYLPYLKDFQLEICHVAFNLIKCIVPVSSTLKRLAFIGQTTTIDAKSWKNLLISYQLIEDFDLCLSNTKIIQLSDIEQWRNEFKNISVDYNLITNIFQIRSSKFERLSRIYLNESIKEINHIDYLDNISHLLIRSQYWCSFIDLSMNIQKLFKETFQHVKRLTTTYRQLEYFLKTNFLNQIEQVDIEFSEQYCYIKSEMAQEFINLRSICLSSMYDGIHQLTLHKIVKDLLLVKFGKINYLNIDSIRIIDDEHIENSICQWYLNKLNQPIVNYIPGQYLSIWF